MNSSTSLNGNATSPRYDQAKRNALPQDQRLIYEISSDGLWDIYAEACMKAWTARYPDRRRDSRFLQEGLTTGRLPRDIAASLRAFIEGLPKHLADISDECPETFAKPYTPKHASDALNRERDFFRIDQRHQADLQPALDCLKEPIEAAYGSCWRIANIRSWKTYPGAKAGSNDWHGDGLPWPVNKIMLYLTDIDQSVGGTEIVRHDGEHETTYGPAGTWCLFQSGYLQHRGIAPQEEYRLALEIATCPAFETDLTVSHSGYGAKYPISPWDSLDLGEPIHGANQGWTDPLERQKRVLANSTKLPFPPWAFEYPTPLERYY